MRDFPLIRQAVRRRIVLLILLGIGCIFGSLAGFVVLTVILAVLLSLIPLRMLRRRLIRGWLLPYSYVNLALAAVMVLGGYLYYFYRHWRDYGPELPVRADEGEGPTRFAADSTFQAYSYAPHLMVLGCRYLRQACCLLKTPGREMVALLRMLKRYRVFDEEELVTLSDLPLERVSDILLGLGAIRSCRRRTCITLRQNWMDLLKESFDR